ncbi:MAG: hypothetical protein L6Q99_08935 [Planctomycetes bacterium]|nr:hypothetical protein [Planctomycetota bacterium]
MNSVGERSRFERGTGPFEDQLLGKLVDMIRGGADPEFGFVRRVEVPWCALHEPLASSRIALVTTAGLHRRDDASFRALEEPLGDPSFRWIAQDTPATELALERGYVDAKYTAVDPEVAFPRRALARLAARGLIGAVAPRHASFVGGVIRPLPGLLEHAQRLADGFAADGVDGVVLVPNCSICVQTVALIASELEARGVPTVAVTLIPELTRFVGAPRALAVHFPFGAPLGDPGHGELHDAVLAEALELLATAPAPRTLVASRQRWRRGPSADA